MKKAENKERSGDYVAALDNKIGKVTLSAVLICLIIALFLIPLILWDNIVTIFNESDNKAVLPDTGVSLKAPVDMETYFHELETEDMEEAEAIVSSDDKLSAEPLHLKDITVFEGDTAVFKCYDDAAIGYEWEYYSSADKQWKSINFRPDMVNSVRTDELLRNVSTLEVPGTEENNLINVRCMVIYENDRKIKEEACLKVEKPVDFINSIRIDDVQAEAGKYLSAESLTVHINNADDSSADEADELTVSGLTSLTFCTKQREDISKSYDAKNKVITEIYTRTYKEISYVMVEEGEQTVPVRLYCADNAYDAEVTIVGSDTTPPDIEDIQTETVDEGNNTKVRIYIDATDNYSNPSDLLYAFGQEQDSDEEEESEPEWNDKLPIEVEVPTEKGGLYNVYVKDKAGNISMREFEFLNEEQLKQETDMPPESETAAPVIIEITEIGK